MTKERKQQFTLRITQANSTQMIVILYEMLLCYLAESKEALCNEDKQAYVAAMRMARNCINELISSLHKGYQPASELLQLYLYCIRRLALCELYRKTEHIDEVVAVIEPLHKAYQEIAPQNQAGPVMNNSETIYAGLTYGRDTLVEDTTYRSTNRGLFI